MPILWKMLEQGDVSSDEFTFPTVADDSSFCHLQFPGFASSPFWYAPAEEKKSFSNVMGSQGSLVPTEIGSGGGRGYIDEEEKMDMLWEHLNEELRDSQEGKNVAGGLLRLQSRRLELEKASATELEDVRQVKTLKVFKRNSMNLHGKKSLMVMFKVLRKLLLLQNSTYHKKV